MGYLEYGKYDQVDFSILTGKTIIEIDNNGAEIDIVTEEGERFKMYHSQDCCESVYVEDVCGNLEDLVGSPILLAEEVSSSEPTEEIQKERDLEKAKTEAEGGYYYGHESETWTFYKLSTIKGSVTIRFYGTSNGYYSESVDFVKLK